MDLESIYLFLVRLLGFNAALYEALVYSKQFTVN